MTDYQSRPEQTGLFVTDERELTLPMNYCLDSRIALAAALHGVNIMSRAMPGRRNRDDSRRRLWCAPLKWISFGNFLDHCSSPFRQRLQQLGQERTDPGGTGFLGFMAWEKSYEPAVGLPRNLRPAIPDATSHNLGLVGYRHFVTGIVPLTKFIGLYFLSIY